MFDDIDLITYVRSNLRGVFGSDRPSYAQVEAFFYGLNCGRGFALFSQFRPWALAQIRNNYNIHWTGLLRILSFDKGYDLGASAHVTEEEDREAAQAAFQVVLDYLEDLYDPKKMKVAFAEFRDEPEL